jgi:hypothetical protein
MVGDTMRPGSMDDVGSRLDHLTELYEIWQTGLDILERYNKRTSFYTEKKAELEAALKLLYCHMSLNYKEPKTQIQTKGDPQ